MVSPAVFNTPLFGYVLCRNLEQRLTLQASSSLYMLLRYLDIHFRLNCSYQQRLPVSGRQVSNANLYTPMLEHGHTHKAVTWRDGTVNSIPWYTATQVQTKRVNDILVLINSEKKIHNSLGWHCDPTFWNKRKDRSVFWITDMSTPLRRTLVYTIVSS